ncbi:MAG: hypothetical protein IPM68_01475 [Flavobacteriales bacterium]|nr:hypothetical protein [Flavobacteriales bacterium]
MARPFPQIAHVAYGRDPLVANGKLYYTGTFVANGLDNFFFLALLEYDGQQVCVMGGPGPILAASPPRPTRSMPLLESISSAS